MTSDCGFSTHRRLLDLARAEGRGVLAVTDHDSAAGGVAVKDLAHQEADDLVVLVGMELTTSDFGHVILFGRGVEQDWGWRKHDPFPRHIPDHWVAIQAHPFREHIREVDGHLDADRLPDLQERIDAVEVWNGGDLIKRTPHLRSELNNISRDYIHRNRKVAVASSDGHRPIWVHSFFTRFARPIGSVDDVVDQVKAASVAPQSRDQAHVNWCIEGWHRRQVVEWHEAGKDWRALAGAAQHDLDEAAGWIATFQRVRELSQRGATLAQIAAETGLSPRLADDYRQIVEEEGHSARKRAAKLA